MFRYIDHAVDEDMTKEKNMKTLCSKIDTVKSGMEKCPKENLESKLLEFFSKREYQDHEDSKMVMTCLLFSLMLLMKQVASLAESENYS